MVQGHTAGRGGALSLSHECTAAISSSSLYCAHTMCQPWTRCWDHQSEQYRHGPCPHRACNLAGKTDIEESLQVQGMYRREAQTALENIGKDFLEKVIFGLRREGGGRHSDITVMGRSKGCVLGEGHSL